MIHHANPPASRRLRVATRIPVSTQSRKLIARRGRAPGEPLALADVATYTDHVAKLPGTNSNENEKSSDAARVFAVNKADFIARRMASVEFQIPSGVYRFKTLEDADEWIDRMTARSQLQKDQT